MTLALIVLTKNQYLEAKNIVRSIGENFEQIYILDDYSSDDVERLAHERNVLVFKHKLSESFADHRNWILDKVKEDWTFFLDADEIVTPNLMIEIKKAISTAKLSAFAIPRQDIFAGKALRFGEVGQIQLVRLGKTKVGSWKRSIHEVWHFPQDKIGELQSPILHYAHQDITQFLVKLHRYAVLEKNERNGRGLGRLIFEIGSYPIGKFLQNYILRQGFRDGYAGLVYAVLMSYYSLIKRIFWYEDLVN